MKIKLSLLFILSYISIFFMYYKIIPINIETQPIFIIGVTFLLMLIAIFKRKKLKKEDSLLYIHISILVGYYVLTIITGGNELLTFFKLIIGPLMYIFILKYVVFLNYNIVKKMIYMMFILFTIIFFKVPVIYNILLIINKTFMDRVRMGMLGTRGIAILSPEPSYTLYFFMLLLFSLDYLIINKNLSRKKVDKLKILIYIMAIFSKSALVYVSVGIYFIIANIELFLKINKKTILKICLIGIFILSFICFKEINDSDIQKADNRFAQVLSSLNNSKYDNIKDTLFYSDESAGTRFITNYLYISTIKKYPFGLGIGGADKRWVEMASESNIDIWRNWQLNTLMVEGKELSPQAYVPYIMSNIGILSIFLILFIFRIRLKELPFQNKIVVINIQIFLLIYMILLQSNLVNPVFWIIIALSKNLQKKVTED